MSISCFPNGVVFVAAVGRLFIDHYFLTFVFKTSNALNLRYIFSYEMYLKEYIFDMFTF